MRNIIALAHISTIDRSPSIIDSTPAVNTEVRPTTTIASVTGMVANTVDGTVSVLRNQRDGTFGPQTTFKAGTSQSIVLADFNGDGKQDIAAASSAGGAVSVLLGLGDGSFAAALSFASTYSIRECPPVTSTATGALICW